MSDYRLVVLLSAYNGEKYIEEQIRSILNQKEIDSLTIIVRDDGSQDNTNEIIHNVYDKHPNVEIIDGSNKGLVASFLELLNYAYRKSYDYYAFSDQDDYWLPEKLSIAIKSLENHHEPCMYASCSTIVDSMLKLSGGTTQKKLRDITFYNSAIQNICPGHNQVLNHALVKILVSKTDYSSSIYSQDMWITKVASLTGRIIFDNTPHTLYRQHDNNQLSFGKSKIEWAKDRIKRLRNDEGKRITRQMKYFCECYQEYLSVEEKDEVTRFINSQDTVLKRIKYIVHSKMYRQKRYETIMFKGIYLMGGYNI